MRTQPRFPRSVFAAALALAAVDATTPAAHAQAGAPAPTVTWTKVNVTLPVSDAIFPAGDGAPIANGYCLMCHSAGMVTRQPPLSPAQWLAEVRKMRTFFGAPIPENQDEALARYLARINGPATARPSGPSAQSTSK